MFNRSLEKARGEEAKAEVVLRMGSVTCVSAVCKYALTGDLSSV